MAKLRVSEEDVRALDLAVRTIFSDLKVLQNNVEGHWEQLDEVLKYKSKFEGSSRGWFWHAGAWAAAYAHLEAVHAELARRQKSGFDSRAKFLVEMCDTCMQDMRAYRDLCLGMAQEAPRPNWAQRLFRLTPALDALKNLG